MRILVHRAPEQYILLLELVDERLWCDGTFPLRMLGDVGVKRPDGGVERCRVRVYRRGPCWRGWHGETTTIRRSGRRRGRFMGGGI